jgi:CDP-glycerol glycerophosphotransferase (TagB/SpsB family)
MANAGRNCIVTGYPKLDAYINNSRIVKNRFKNSDISIARIIYAPHHSFSNRLSFATFQWNGRELLEYARVHPETSWVFKPHPRLKYELVASGFMTLQEANDYYSAWNNLQNTCVYDQGDYIDLFVESSALVTDCISFIGEYLPSGHPVILLVNPESAGYNEFGKAVIAHYYQVKDIVSLREKLDLVAINGNDSFREQRISDVQTIFPQQVQSARIITEALASTLLLTGKKNEIQE